MKRLVLALAAIGLTASLSAYAAVPTGAQATDVKVPVDQAGFFVGGSALYLQPSISGGAGNLLDYATITDNNGPYHKTLNIDPSYNWGFDVFGGYAFGNGNDLTLKYARLHTKDDESVIAPAGTYVNRSRQGNDALPLRSAKGEADFDLDQIDLLAGQQVNIGCAHKLHLFGGLRYVKLNTDVTNQSSANPNNTADRTGAALTSEDQADFKGIGPIIGAEGNYYLGYGVGLVAGVDSGLLVGKLNGTEDIVEYNSAGVPNPKHYETDSRRGVVPVVDAKLGLDYTFPFQNYGSLTAEAGWKVSQYWNAAEQSNYNSYSNPNSSGNEVSSTSTSDISYQGPYVTLTYRGIPTL